MAVPSAKATVKAPIGNQGLGLGRSPTVVDAEVQPLVPTAVVDNTASAYAITPPSGAPTEQDLFTVSEQTLAMERAPEPSKLDSFKVGFAPTATDWIKASKDKLVYQRDPDFNPTEYTNEWTKEWGAGEQWEIQYANKAVSFDDWKNRTVRMVERREANKALAANPLTGIAASVLDVDTVLGLVPYVGWAAKGARMTQLGVRAAAGIAAGAGAYGINVALDDQSTRDWDMKKYDSLILGLSVALAPTKIARGALAPPTPNVPRTALDDAVDLELNTVRPSKVIPDDTVFTEIKAGDLDLSPRVRQSLANETAKLREQLAKPISTDIGTPSDFTTKNGWFAGLLSSADKLWHLTKGDQSTKVNWLLAGVHTQGDNVASAQAQYLNNYSARLALVEKDLFDAVNDITSSNVYNRVTGKFHNTAKAVFSDFQDYMQKIDSVVVAMAKNGNKPTDDQIKIMIAQSGANPSMQRAMESYVDSAFAVSVLRDAKGVGLVDDAGLIVERSTYMPVRHSFEAIHNAITVRGIATIEEVWEFYGKQITRIYPELLEASAKQGGRSALTPIQVGKHFVQTQYDAATSLADVATTGLTKEQIHNLLTRSGLGADDAGAAVNRIFDASSSAQGVQQNLRSRLDWDWNMPFESSTGNTFTMKDLTDTNTFGNLEQYARRMASRSGLAQYGIKTEAELRSLLEGYLTKLPEGADMQKARAFMSDVADDLLGRPVGGNVPEAIRSSQALADMFLLANSGLYGIVDLLTQVYKTGLIKSFPHIYKGMQAAFTGMRTFNIRDAKTLEEILTTKLIAPSRWKNFMTHYTDNFNIGGGIHEASQYYGQSARFMNLSEYLKRFQIGMLMGVYGDALRGAAKGSASDLKYLKTKMHMSDDLINGIKVEWGKHGGNIDSWSSGVRVQMEQKIFHESDNLAYTIQKGEVPSILEHSAVGKVIFPYMRFTFSMTNKIMRRTLAQDGATGLAMLMAVQFPAAMAVGASINIRNGKDYDDNLAGMTVRSMSALGGVGYPMEMLFSGFTEGSVTALAPVGKLWNFGAELGSDSPDLMTLKKNSPLNAMVAIDLLNLAFKD